MVDQINANFGMFKEFRDFFFGMMFQVMLRDFIKFNANKYVFKK